MWAHLDSSLRACNVTIEREALQDVFLLAATCRRFGATAPLQAARRSGFWKWTDYRSSRFWQHQTGQFVVTYISLNAARVWTSDARPCLFRSLGNLHRAGG